MVPPLVRDLYRRFLWVGRDYPGGLRVVRPRVKAALLEWSPPPTDALALAKAVAVGRAWVRELEGVVQLRKYRAMRRAYGGGSGLPTEAELTARVAASVSAEEEAVCEELAEQRAPGARRAP